MLEKLTKDGMLWLKDEVLYLSSAAGLETVVYAYNIAFSEGKRLVEYGPEGNA